MKVAIVHDWLTGMRGGEKCLEVFCQLFPEAHVYTLLYKEGSVSPAIQEHWIHTSNLQRWPGVSKYYRNFLPLFPSYVESFDLSEYDLVLSSSHCVALGAITRRDQTHVCYCYTPMRYIHDMYETYFDPRRVGRAKRAIVDMFAGELRSWDASAGNRPDHFIAISRYIAERIRRVYHRDSTVIYPPVDTKQFKLGGTPEDFYLIVGSLVPYKRVDLAIEAFRRMGKALIVIGDGPELDVCRDGAPMNIDFLGWRDDAAIAYYYQRCKALIFPGEEDFGITPLEAQASGRPVIAFGRGGARETVQGLGMDGVDKPTGLFFEEQTPESLIEAVRRFEENADRFDPEACRANALRFDRCIFSDRMHEYIDRVMHRR